MCYKILVTVKNALCSDITVEELNVVMDEIMEQATERYREWSQEAA